MKFFEPGAFRELQRQIELIESAVRPQQLQEIMASHQSAFEELARTLERTNSFTRVSEIHARLSPDLQSRLASIADQVAGPQAEFMKAVQALECSDILSHFREMAEQVSSPQTALAEAIRQLDLAAAPSSLERLSEALNGYQTQVAAIRLAPSLDEAREQIDRASLSFREVVLGAQGEELAQPETEQLEQGGADIVVADQDHAQQLRDAQHAALVEAVATILEVWGVHPYFLIAWSENLTAADVPIDEVREAHAALLRALNTVIPLDGPGELEGD